MSHPVILLMGVFFLVLGAWSLHRGTAHGRAFSVSRLQYPFSFWIIIVGQLAIGVLAVIRAFRA